MVKADQKRWWSFFLFFVICHPVLPQAMTVVGDEKDDTANISSTTQQETTVPFQLAADGQASPAAPQTPAKPDPDQKPYGWHYAIYPVLAWAPIFGVNVTLPSLPSNPIAPGPSGSTNSSFNGAYFGGARIEKGKWSANALFMWAALSSTRTTPHTAVHLDFVFGNAMAGREVFRDLYLEGGFRRMALTINATVGTDNERRSPGYWDPLIGLTYRKQLGKKWRILIHGDGGGFGVGSDVDVAATGIADWQFTRHFGIALGYGGMHFSDSNTVAGRTLTIKPTLNGPIIGFGIYF